MTVDPSPDAEWQQRGQAYIIRARGDLDDSSWSPLDDLLGQAREWGEGDVVLDLRDVDFMSRRVLERLRALRDELAAAGRSLVLASPARAVRRTLELDSMLDGDSPPFIVTDVD